MTVKKIGLGLLALAATILMAPAASAQDMYAGKVGFAKNCSACHQLTGLGIKGAFPALSGSPIAQGPEDVMISLVLQGRGGMPSFKGAIPEQTLADILTYVRGSWANHASEVSPEQIMSIKQALSEVDQRPKGN